MRKILLLMVSVLMMFAFTLPVAAAPLNVTARTYTVLVGAENVPMGIGVMAFFPGTLKVHVGDTVVWKVQTHEIHTVTFLAPGQAMPELVVPAPAPFPPEAMMFNPEVAFPVIPAGGAYDGTTYANSGILSTDPGNGTQFSLTFTKEGTFSYVCLVHGTVMSGTITVVSPSVSVPSPTAVLKSAQRQVTTMLAKGRTYIGLGRATVPAPVHNPDGTTAYTVMIGYSKGQVDLMHFFPSKLVVHPGDTVKFELSPTNEAPHTVTFLNGNADIPLVDAVPNPPNPPLLLLNAAAVLPSQMGVPLSHTGVYSSGLLAPGSPSTSYTLTIGNELGTYNYECLLHDTSGMQGVLQVVAK